LPGVHRSELRGASLPASELAPAVSRAALTATALGIPDDVFQNALLLVSELVTNSVMHARSDWVELSVDLDERCLRIEVSDPDDEPIRPRTPDLDGGWGLTLVAASATRWGVERESGGKKIWVEFDLPT
jgi:anti-sigma regulatory factor (Ser/Thr protein kinase)